MKVLIVGSGGREHTLAWAIAKSPRLERLFVAPGNGGTATIAENVPIAADSVDALLEFANGEDIDLTVVGPEAPLVAGIVNRFREAGRCCFGPTAAAARLEGSKVFAKEFMLKHGVPTAAFEVFEDAASARDYLRDVRTPVVVKADGLAAGKGVIVATNDEEAESAIEDIMVQRSFGDAGQRIIVESFLEGEEVSVHSICGGGRAVLLPSSQDHKRAFDGDKGPNTGGMGAYGPVPFDDSAFSGDRGMEADGFPFSGVLYAGLMVTNDGLRVLEFNVRFGDPETQVLLPLVKSDLLGALHDAATGAVSDIELHEGRSAATVVVASRGYPGSYEKGKAITGLDGVNDANTVVFHAGTETKDDGLVTSGGRVLAVSSWGDDLRAAIRGAYDGVEKITFDGAFYRKDIGHRAL
jgi:phosphoribosylamine--glycine ligase